jgi:uncharacterized RDD family membrane protein YckC
METIMGYASWGRRALAFVIDLTAYVVPVVLASFITDAMGIDAAAQGKVLLGAWLVGFVLFEYSRWFLGGRTGQSFGRKALSISVLDLYTGKPAGIATSAIRDICHLFDFFFCLGFLRPLWHARKQTFADTIEDTVSVNAPAGVPQWVTIRPGGRASVVRS